MWGAAFDGRARELAAACARVFERWPIGSELWRALATVLAATAHLVDGRLDEALRRAIATIERPDGSPLARVAAWRILGHTLRQQGDLETAANCLQRAESAAANAGLVAFERELGTLLAPVLGAGDAL